MKNNLFRVLIMILTVTLCLSVGSFAIENETTPVLKIASANLSLNDSIYLYFYSYYDDIDTSADEYGMIYWLDEQQEGAYTYANAAAPGKAVIQTGSSEWFHHKTLNKDVATFKYPLSAKMIADVLYVQAYAKKGDTYYYSSVVKYGATTYIARKLGLVNGVAASTNRNLIDLLHEMLNYGAKAQLYFNYNTENLATDILIPSYTVTFKDDEGGIIEEIPNVKSGDGVTPPTAPEKPGYTFVGWDTAYDSITKDTTVTAIYEEITTPMFLIDRITAAPGEQDVQVAISVKNNPGILGMALTVSYDENAMTMTGATNGSAVSNVLALTKSKSLGSGCMFLWDGQEVPPAEIRDGDILLMSFDIMADAQDGSYPITISCASDIIDNNLVPVMVTISNGSVTVQ